MLSNNINIVLNTAFTAHTISFCGFDKEADTTVTQLCLYWNMLPSCASHQDSHTPTEIPVN